LVYFAIRRKFDGRYWQGAIAANRSEKSKTVEKFSKYGKIKEGIAII